MDKKTSNLRQGFNKALSSDCRKSSDVNKQQWPRNAHRRENSNLSNSKVDPQRSNKQASAKSRPNVDKRPKPRGGGTGANNNGSHVYVPLFGPSTSGPRLVSNDAASEDDQIDFEFELNSISASGSKKQNLNHLLNFYYSPREYENSNGYTSSRIGSRNNLKKHRYNKEQFLQANFQFVINAGAECNISPSSPDTLIDWSLIEQINIQTTEELQCPICLYPPVAAKLTRCGHAYCWPCILHYLALTDKSWRKCPICYDAVHVGDLKSTVILQQTNFIVGDYIKLQLMQREKGKMLIEKVDNESSEGKIPHMSAGIERTKFSKFLLADHDEVSLIMKRETNELIAGQDNDSPENIFIQQALNLLEKRKKEIHSKLAIDEKGFENLNVTSIEKVGNEENLTNLNNKEKNSSSNYYFYQSVDGQNIFLHPLNVKMLQAMYGSLDQSPPLIEAKILQKEIQSMSEDLRKKFSCLGHLPLTCQFEIVEIQLEPPLVSVAVMDMFRDDILARQKNRIRRAKEEMKREKQINEIHERQMGKLITRSANIDIKSADQFPTCGQDEYPKVSSLRDFDESQSTVSSSQSSTQSKLNHTSFANVLSSPEKETYVWPSLNNASSSPSLLSKQHKSAVKWGRDVHIQSKRNVGISENENITDKDSTFDSSIDNFSRNFGDVLADALLKTQLEINQPEGGNCSSVLSAGKKKKNKSKKTLLFSTGINFNGN